MDDGKMAIKDQHAFGDRYWLILSHFDRGLRDDIVINGKRYKNNLVLDTHMPTISIPKTENLDLIGCVAEIADYKKANKVWKEVF